MLVESRCGTSGSSYVHPRIWVTQYHVSASIRRLDRLYRDVMEQPTNQPPTTPVVWQLIISHPYTNTEVIHDYLTKNTDRWLCSQHDADEEINRTHTHFMLVNYKYTKVSLTKEINKTWKGSDNFGILTTRPEGKGPYDEYHVGKYISKGREHAFTDNGHSHGIANNILQTYIDNYFADRESKEATTPDDNVSKKPGCIQKIQYKLKYESPAQKKIRKNDFVKECLQVLKEKYPNRNYTDSDALDIVRCKLNEYNEVFGIYTAIDYYDTMMARVAPGKFLAQCLQILEKRKCRN